MIWRPEERNLRKAELAFERHADKCSWCFVLVDGWSVQRCQEGKRLVGNIIKAEQQREVL